MLEAIREAEASGNITYVDSEELAPNFGDVHAKAHAFTSMISNGDYVGARTILSGMIDVSFESAPLTILIANAYEQMQDYAQAIAVLGIYMGLRPPHEYFYQRLARLLKKQGHDRTAAAMIEKGWTLRKKGLRGSELERAKQEYFT
jgi:predicted Zn-dependent protease